MAKLRVIGSWKGEIEVELENWTVPMLRQELGKRWSLDPGLIKLIFAGKVLSDGDSDGAPTLAQLGMKNNAKIFTIRVATAEEVSSIMAEEERSRRLARVNLFGGECMVLHSPDHNGLSFYINWPTTHGDCVAEICRAAAAALTKRIADGSLPLEVCYMGPEDEKGEKVKFVTDTEERQVMMALVLHAKAKNLIAKEKYYDALEVLGMAEEAILLCNDTAVEVLDNVSMMQIDMVWCYFLLSDLKRLPDAGVRLEKAREGVDRGLQAGRTPGVTLNLRLELLEGVVAFHTGQLDKARNALKSAHAKFLWLQVRDEALSIVMSKGIGEKEAVNAIQYDQGIRAAVDLIAQQRVKRAQKEQENLQSQEEILIMLNGETPLKNAVDMKMLNRLASIGIHQASTNITLITVTLWDVAAYALLIKENDFQKALDALTCPDTNSKLQVLVEPCNRDTQERLRDAVDKLISMGSDESREIDAFEAGGAQKDTIQQIRIQKANLQLASVISTALTCISTSDGSSDMGGRESISGETGNGNEVEPDVEMEVELIEDIARMYKLSVYDIDLTREGEAINKYLSMLNQQSSR